MTDYAKKILKEFLDTEFFCVEAADGIIQFILDANIRNGEYEGNEFILKKLNLYNFVIFKEYVYRDAMCPEISCVTAFSRDELLNAMYPVLERLKAEGRL